MKPISTKHLLEKKIYFNRNDPIDVSGRTMVYELLRDPSIDNFLNLSKDFAKKYGLLDGYCKGPIKKLESFGVKCSVALFGHTLFTIVNKDLTENVIQLLKQFEGTLLVCGIDNFGARLI
jgi:pantoate kinase